jgi:putative ABC transport system substrate-binding protein
MRRREFLAGVGGAAAWPMLSQAQQGARLPRIGVVMNTQETDPEGRVRLDAFTDALKGVGLMEGQGISLDVRWTAGEPARIEQQVAEMLAREPDIVLAWGAFAVRSLQKRSTTVPIVFVQITDPVQAGFVGSLARPGGNVTGFTQFEYDIGGKWVELLREIAPRTQRIVVAWDDTNAAGRGQLQIVRSAASSSAMDVMTVDVRQLSEVEKIVRAATSRGNAGLIVLGSSFASAHREQLTALAANNDLPAIYPYKHFVSGKGLMSYGPDTIEQFRQAAGYVHRILKGEKPADLPVQAPTKFELAINLKAARTLGITVPPTLLARADEVIE